jgi:hypothetical protein
LRIPGSSSVERRESGADSCVVGYLKGNDFQMFMYTDQSFNLQARWPSRTHRERNPTIPA